MAPLRRRAYQAWSSGPVVESTKYGSPTVTASNPRIRQIGSFGRGGFPCRVRIYGQGRGAGQQKSAMHQHLRARLQVAHQGVRIEIAQQQNDLEEQQTGGPHGGRPAKPGQDDLGDHRLHLKEQEGAGQNGKSVKKHLGTESEPRP